MFALGVFMANMPPMSDLESLVSRFTEQLATLIEAQVNERALASVQSAFPGRSSGRRGRPPKGLVLAGVSKKRRKGPIQLCPVPGCKNRAAPVFGMVCAKHKDLPKAKIKQYREARRAKKLKKAA